MSIYVDQKYINLLSGQLERFTRKRDDLYNFRCPICGDSQKKKHKARGYVYRKENLLFYRCHNCSASMSLAILIKEINPESIKKIKHHKSKKPISRIRELVNACKLKKTKGLITEQQYSSMGCSIKWRAI